MINNVKKSTPLFLRLFQRQHRLISMGHEFVHLHCCRSCLAVHIGLLSDDGGGGALYTHAEVERAALLPER